LERALGVVVSLLEVKGLGSEVAKLEGRRRWAFDVRVATTGRGGKWRELGGRQEIVWHRVTVGDGKDSHSKRRAGKVEVEVEVGRRVVDRLREEEEQEEG